MLLSIVVVAAGASWDSMVLWMADDGCGIPAGIIDHLFEPFFTTRRGRGGSELGLNIVYNIVTRRLGGTVSVDSAVGKGMVLPRQAPMAAGEKGNV